MANDRKLATPAWLAPITAHVFAWLAWVAVLWWLWMLLVGEWTTTEVVAASCAAAPAAAFAEFIRTKGVGPVRVPLRLVAAANTVPAMIFVDFAIITWALLRAALHRERVGGSFRVKSLALPSRRREAVGARAWTTLSAGYSPNAYVIDIDVDDGSVLLHELVPHGPSEEPA